MPSLSSKPAKPLTLACAAGAMVLLTGAKGLEPKDVADMLHAVMSADRTVYTKQVVNRLTLKEKVITASEHFEDNKALPLPAQMFRFGAELAAEQSKKFSYSLLSLWPVNKQNAPRTDAEKKGLEFVAANKGQNFYTEEKLGNQRYFTAVYADTAVAQACVTCHNDHKDSPRRDFKMNDVLGGVVIRIPITE
ncbi:MAG: DUF3365 domain-containing protein [Hyphomicrobiaceae bacterium]|nr:MAG: DUF3365 domain-containing protein [Hyphomicrobiaceae bacterium]